MKHTLTCLYLLLLMLLPACEAEVVPTEATPNTVGRIFSRETSDVTVLPSGSQALFNATGGLDLENQVLTFDGSSWKGDEELKLTDGSTQTTLTALYPAYNDEALITTQPYADNALTDVLIAQSTLSSGESEIELTFQHLFSMLTLHVQSSLNDNLSLAAPKVESIGTDGTFTLSGTMVTTLDKNETGDYTFIIPPQEDCTLTLTLGGVSQSFTHTFVGGHKYECKVISKDAPGIWDVQDLIDFSRLINGASSVSSGKTLSDFGEDIDGKRVYYLRSDIALAETDCESLYPIGYEAGFEDIFDGQGHTISGYVMPDDGFGDKYIGFFSVIKKNGIVKDLHLDNVKNTEKNICDCVGGIAGKNSGIIQYCSVQNSIFKSRSSEIDGAQGSQTGGICGQVEGYIINCYTENNSFIRTTRGKTGDIAGNIYGYILNCYSYKNKHSTYNYKWAYSGGIAGQSSLGHIYNCYVYKNSSSETPPTAWGALLGVYDENTEPQIGNFFYNIENTYGSNANHNNPTGTTKYDSNFQVDGTHISTLLNQWIEENASTDPTLTFNKWKVADDGSAIFE